MADTNDVFQLVVGVDVKVERIEGYDTGILTTDRGQEWRLQRRPYPKSQFRLQLNALRTNVPCPFQYRGETYNEVEYYYRFFNDHSGQADTFLFVDPHTDTQIRVRFSDDVMDIARVVGNLAQGIWKGQKVTLETASAAPEVTISETNPGNIYQGLGGYNGGGGGGTGTYSSTLSMGAKISVGEEATYVINTNLKAHQWGIGNRLYYPGLIVSAPVTFNHVVFTWRMDNYLPDNNEITGRVYDFRGTHDYPYMADKVNQSLNPVGKGVFPCPARIGPGTFTEFGTRYVGLYNFTYQETYVPSTNQSLFDGWSVGNLSANELYNNWPNTANTDWRNDPYTSVRTGPVNNVYTITTLMPGVGPTTHLYLADLPRTWLLGWNLPMSGTLPSQVNTFTFNNLYHMFIPYLNIFNVIPPAANDGTPLFPGYGPILESVTLGDRMPNQGGR